MDTNSQEIARRVVSAMETAGVSERGLVRITGIPRDRLRSRLKAELPFTVTELFAVAGALSVSPLDLMPEERA